jgi:Rnk N-terminus
MNALPEVTITSTDRRRLVPLATAALPSERDGVAASMLLSEIGRANIVRGPLLTALSLNSAIANPSAPMIAKSPMQIPAIRAAVPRMNSALAYPVIHWSSRTSPPTTRNARTAMTRPKRMDARRARSAGDKTLMAALYEFTNLRELVGRGVGLVQRSARSGEQHEAAANATVECLVFEVTRKRYAQTEFFSVCADAMWRSGEETASVGCRP